MANSPVMSDPVLHILLALSDSPRHGYAIIQEIEERTRGRVVIGTGTLYTALKRLRREGLIVEEGPAGGGDGGRETQGRRSRRTYSLTARGRAELSTQTERLQALFDHARQKKAFGADHKRSPA